MQSVAITSFDIGEPDKGTLRLEAFKSDRGAMVCEFQWMLDEDDGTVMVGIMNGVELVSLVDWLVTTMQQIVRTG